MVLGLFIKMWTSRYRVLYKKPAIILLHNHIYTSSLLFAKTGIRKRLRVAHEPGMRLLNKTLQSDSELRGEFYDDIQNDSEYYDDLDLTKPKNVYDSYVVEGKQKMKKIQQRITASKFFAPRTQPLMLTWNERQCIRYLHNQDPMQWDIKTLSESFPATPDTIKKIIKSKAKFTPERIRFMDSRAQKNWELLAEGKLDADPHVVEHLKKFVNKREVLLEQINNSNFYLPEIKEEHVWNQGEMTNILVKYEKELEKLTKNFKTLSDGVSEEKTIKKEEKSSLDLVQEKIKIQSREEPTLKDSFLLKEAGNTFSTPVTLRKLENSLLEKAEKGQELALTEKAILDFKSGMKSLDNFKNENKRNSPDKINIKLITSDRVEEKTKKTWESKATLHMNTHKASKDVNDNSKMMKVDISTYSKSKPLAYNTKCFNEAEISKFLHEIEAKSECQKLLATEVGNKEKLKTDFSDPERLDRENKYYGKEVNDIANTPFWNKAKNKKKELIEYEKQWHEEPIKIEMISKYPALSTDVYPKRIKIPKKKWGSGLTFKVKDCYYDDDGEFLYRVPGMTK